MITVILTEQDYKGETMKNLILILTIFLIGEVFAQPTAPSSYTTNYGFRKWVQGANPSADSINANWDLADTKIKLAYDSASVKMNLYGDQDVQGTKYFFGMLQIGSSADRNARFVLQNYGNAPTYAGELATTTSGNYLRFYGAGNDTVAMLSDIRDGAGGYAMLSGASFTGDVSAGQDFRTPYDSVSFTGSSINADNKSFIHLMSSGATNETIETITGGSDGKILYLINTDAGGYTMTIKDNVGNIETSGDFVMGTGDTMILLYNSVASKWYELSRSNN